MQPVLHIRSYDGDGAPHAHAVVQVVLPIAGALDIEIDGRGGRLTPALSAFIAPGERHVQAGLAQNRSLVLDAPAAAFSAPALDRLSRARFFAPPPRLQRLAEFAALGADGLGPADRAALAHLLTGAIEAPAPSPIELLRAAIRRDPGADWSVARMARRLGVGRSGLYRLLAGAQEATPGRFVARLRLEAAEALILGGRAPLADIALACGFSDQAALTRAMRRGAGHTPGALRRARKDTPGQ